MKRICHLSSVHRGLDIRIFRKECASLAKAGFDTHLIINATPAEVDEASHHGVTLHAMKNAPDSGRFSRMTAHAWRVYQAAKRLDADLYHFHDPELIPYGLLLARSGKKVIYDVHEDLSGCMYSKDWIPPKARPAFATMSHAVQLAGARWLSAVVTATPHIGSIFDGAARRVVVVNNYPMVGELAGPVRSDFNKRDSVCYVGGIDVIRGIREVIKAIEKTGCKLLLAGDFSTDALRAEVSQRPGWNRVKEYGFVNRQQVSEIMARSFSGLVTFYPEPNHTNAQPNKMFEYMAAGVPVIASNFPLWRQIIEGNKCGICVDPTDPRQIADAIDHLSREPEQAAQMGRNGQRAVEQKYHWNLEEAKLLALYRSLLDEE